MVFDGHPTVARYISESPNYETKKMTEEWKSKHVRTTRYCLQIVKCENKTCCLLFRSGYFTVVKERFLPPIPVVQTRDGLKWVQDDKGATYLTLHQYQAMKDQLRPAATLRKYPGEVPYDFSNPAVKENVTKKRICKFCGLYFGAINIKEIHQKECRVSNSTPVTVETQNSTQEEPRRVRPVRVKARRGVELLCLMENDVVDWYDFDEVDVSDVELPPERSVEHGTPVIGNMEPIWADDTKE